MPSRASADLSQVGEFRNWKPEHQAKALELLQQADASGWRPFYCPIFDCDGHPHGDGTWGWEHARADQRPPAWAEDWLTLLLAGGRGSGKTRTGSEITHRVTRLVPRIALVAATGPDLRDTIVEGVSGILACSPPGGRPLWEPSKKQLTWPNGCIAQGFSAEEPDRLRGPQFGFSWLDEPAHYPLIEEVWDVLLFGLRIGEHPHIVATSTPKPTKWMRAMIKDPKTITHRVSTYANLQNLSPTFRETIMNRYEGTRIGRQELHGEVLEDVEGALWTWEMFARVADAPLDLVRIVIGVDPAGTATKRSDETGIIVVGIDSFKNVYVLHDASGKYSPAGWAKKVNDLYEQYSADAIVPEKNYGGDMVRHTLESSGYRGARIIMATSRRGKAIRAEPIVALYEKNRVFHAGESLTELEHELTSWVPSGKDASPNRLDALVHGVTELAKVAEPAAIANPNTLLRNYRPSKPPWSG